MHLSARDPWTFVGRNVDEIPTPSLVISQPILQHNVNQLLEDVSNLRISFRPHLKTLKSLEVTKLMLGQGKHRKVVASTLPEIRGILPLVKQGLVDECLYGLPLYPSVLPLLEEFRNHMKIILMIDNEQHIDIVENYNRATAGTSAPWEAFIKIDVGSQRAGVGLHVSRLKELVKRVKDCSEISVYGFYCHAGHSYSCRGVDEATKVLQHEVSCVLEATALLSSQKSVVISVGATPTAHVIESLKVSLPSNVKLELHAGNFPANDLQQVSTGLVDVSRQAIRVVGEVCSVYPERNEVLSNIGVLALSRETSSFTGYGSVVGRPEWALLRLSQEHGIIGMVPEAQDAPSATCVENIFTIGQKVFVYCQHACITAAAYPWYFIVNGNDKVVDVWMPWKYW